MRMLIRSKLDMEIRPDKEKILLFVGASIGTGLLVFFASVLFGGFSLGAFTTSLLVALVIFAPFGLFVIPSFLVEKIIVETFTLRFYLLALVFPVKRVLMVEDLTHVESRSALQPEPKTGPAALRRPRGGEAIKKRKPFLAFVTKETDVVISRNKYKPEEIDQLIKRLKALQPSITVDVDGVTV